MNTPTNSEALPLTNCSAFVVFTPKGKPVKIATSATEAWQELCSYWTAKKCREYYRKLGYYGRTFSLPRIVSHPIDRHLDGMPSIKCMIEIWVDGEWLECEWHPKKEDSEASDGYLGTARTTCRPIQIGFHAWRQNDHEFREYKILGANDKI